MIVNYAKPYVGEKENHHALRSNIHIGGLKEEYIKNDTGAILRLPFSFVVQTSISGSGEVIAVA